MLSPHGIPTASVKFFITRFFTGGIKFMYQVLKRDGGTVEFEISKISSAMIKAFEAQ